MTEKKDHSVIKTGCEALTACLPDHSSIPRLGLGTWHMGENPQIEEQEISALQAGIKLGMTLIDTAEMYGNGRSEQLVGKSIQGFNREKLYLVSKVYPHNAGRKNIFNSCENSLKRMNTDYLDLYLLHWRGGVPLSETVACMEQLKADGKIRNWGVSNFDIDDMKELWNVPSGNKCAVNQVLYHLGSRGIEFSLLPWLQEHGVQTMAYCPTAQGGTLRRGLLTSKAVLEIAKIHDATPVQILLSFLLYQKDTLVIPKSSTAAHTIENAGASLIQLTQDDIFCLSREFPAPTRKTHLDLL
ncbi:aldo/keto reductase [Oscillospiraceae bacterium PP1C4]